MESIYDLVRGRHTKEVSPETSVAEAAAQMVQHNIGAIAVTAEGKLQGIFSERDVLKRVVAERRDPAATPVRDVMTTNPVTVAPTESLERCRTLMREGAFRHLPICDQGKLVGIISIRDLLLHDIVEKDQEVSLMRAYIATNT